MYDKKDAFLVVFYRKATRCRQIGNLSGNFTGSGYLPDKRTGGGRIRVRCVRGVVDLRIVYSDSLYFSDQFSCTNYFHPSYGLKYINFQSFI